MDEFTDLISKVPLQSSSKMKHLTDLLENTYGLSGPNINMELLRMIGTFL